MEDTSLFATHPRISTRGFSCSVVTTLTIGLLELDKKALHLQSEKRLRISMSPSPADISKLNEAANYHRRAPAKKLLVW
jgi:hypothetical protein